MGRPHVPQAGAFMSTAAPQYGHGLVGVAIRDPLSFQDRTVTHAEQPPQPSGVLCVVRGATARSEEHTSELQSRRDLVCRLLLEKKKKKKQKESSCRTSLLRHDG